MALASIIPTSKKTPGIFIDVALGVGPRSALDAPIKVILTGNKTTAGTATVTKVVEVSSVDDARTLFGAGSELFLMARAAFRVNPSVRLYAIPIAESAGTAASATITITGTATAAGSILVDVLGERIEVAVASGDAQDTIAANVELAIDKMTDWPVTASVATNVVTVTAKLKGPRGNFVSLRASSTAAGVTAAASAAYLGSGATSDDPQAALDEIAPERFHLIVAPYQDSTQLTKYRTHVNTTAAPEIGKRQRFVAASIDTLANTKTVSDALNAKRLTLGWHYNADDTPAMLGAAYAGRIAAAEGRTRAKNMDGTAMPYIKPQASLADRPLGTEIDSALDSGITPFSVTTAGEVFIVRPITNYHQDASNNPDYGVLDLSKVAVSDFLADDIEVFFASEFAGYLIAPDDPEGDAPPPGVLTPSMGRDAIYARLKLYENTLITDVDASAPNILVEIAASPAGRLNGSIPINVIEQFHQGAFQLRQVG